MRRIEFQKAVEHHCYLLNNGWIVSGQGQAWNEDHFHASGVGSSNTVLGIFEHETVADGHRWFGKLLGTGKKDVRCRFRQAQLIRFSANDRLERFEQLSIIARFQ